MLRIFATQRERKKKQDIHEKSYYTIFNAKFHRTGPNLRTFDNRIRHRAEVYYLKVHCECVEITELYSHDFF